MGYKPRPQGRPFDRLDMGKILAGTGRRVSKFSVLSQKSLIYLNYLQGMGK